MELVRVEADQVLLVQVDLLRVVLGAVNRHCAHLVLAAASPATVSLIFHVHARFLACACESDLELITFLLSLALQVATSLSILSLICRLTNLVHQAVRVEILIISS